MDFIISLHDYTFEHLTSIRSLKFYASVHAPLGYSYSGAELPLKGASMPLLEDLELGNVFVGQQLLEFLASFPDKLVDARVAIHRFMLTIRGGSIKDGVWTDNIQWENRPLSETAVAAQKIPGATPERHVFMYAHLGDKYRYFSENEDVNAEAVVRGGDQAAYERFMKTVVENHWRLMSETSETGEGGLST
ncbi:hypothetical protein RB595_003833 [Gaeumannomyces hyphopodioides]